jgi:subtilisin family serine protease
MRRHVFTGPHRRSVVSRTLELLEPRRMLTMVPAGELFNDKDGMPTIRMNWQGQQHEQIPGRWIVQLNNYVGTPVQQKDKATNALRKHAPHIQLVRYMGDEGLFLVRAPLTQTPGNVVQALSKLPGYSYAEPDFRYELLRTPNDPSYPSMWGLNNTGQTGGVPDADIDAPELWDMTTGNSGVVVAMVDSGIDLTHPDLAANIWVNPGEIAGNGIDDDGNTYIDDINGWDWWGNGPSDGVGDSNPTDQNNHGTHTGGTVGAIGNNGVGVTGVNWSVKLMACKIGGAGSAVSGADAVTAMNYILDMKNRGVNVRVSNHSWGGGGFNASMNAAIGNHAANGLVFVGAAGNNGINTDASPFYPAGYAQPNILSIGNLTASNTRSGTSNFGATSVDLFAPGSSILSTIRQSQGSYGTISGTSMASPHVAGAVAMGFNVYTGNSYAPVRDAVMQTTTAVPALTGLCVTGGRLDANLMLEKLIFNLTGGVLTITGTISDDLIQLNFGGGNVTATVGPASGVSSRTLSYPAANVNSIVVLGQNGNDTIEVLNTETNSPISINGGAGLDTINVVENVSSSLARIEPSAGDDVVNVNTSGAGAAFASFSATQTIGALNIGAGGFASVAPSGLVVLISKALSLTGSGTLDMNDNDFILDYTGASQLAVIQALINSARNGGNWLGNGITSTSARNDANQITTLGAMTSAEFWSIYGNGTPFSGQPIDNTAVLVKHTYYADTDHNGLIDGDDYSRTDSGFNGGLNGWMNGDADGNGVIDGDDYSLLDAAFNLQGAVL